MGLFSRRQFCHGRWGRTVPHGRLTIVKPKTKSAVIITVLLLAFLALGTLVKMPVAAMGPGPTFNTLGYIRVPSNPREGGGSTSSTSAAGGKGKLVPVIDITGAPLDQVDGHLNICLLYTSPSPRD